ncbi:MAG: ATP-binding protein [Planctomycetes bacterium]|nr:ATP-binding protein [Planctomycetota bacterium]
MSAITFLELRTSAVMGSIRVLNELLEVALRALGTDPALQHDLALGVAELVANVVEHECQATDGEGGEVEIRLDTNPGELVLSVVSKGPPFDLDAALEKAANHDPLEDLDGSGLGLPLLTALFDLSHTYEPDRGNVITLRRKTD